MDRISILRDLIKLEALIAYSCMYGYIVWVKHYHGKVLSIGTLYNLWRKYKETRHYIGPHYREFIYTKHLVLDAFFFTTIPNMLNGLIGTAWLCEKLKVNLRVEGVPTFFDNDVIINNPAAYQESHFNSTKKFLAGAANITYIGMAYIYSEYGRAILSRLSMKEKLRKSADEWFDNNIKENWIAVHYRGTDVNKESIAYVRYIPINDYIAYLQRALPDNQCSIFVCSDQAQFIDEMHAAFPGRVFARDIQRSSDKRSLHRDPVYKGPQQKQDTIIDMLILAKAPLIYTTGSGMVDAVRFLNPLIKIISLDERWLIKGFSIGRGSPNGALIPEKDLAENLFKYR